MEYKSIRIQEEINIKLNRLKFIIELGANINIKNYDGYSPFIISYMCNNITVLNYLLEQRADIDIKDNYGISPLIDATLNGN